MANVPSIPDRISITLSPAGGPRLVYIVTAGNFCSLPAVRVLGSRCHAQCAERQDTRQLDHVWFHLCHFRYSF